MDISDVVKRTWKDRGFHRDIDYRVLAPDLRVVCTTKDLEKAERIAEQCGGTIHPSKELE